MWRKHKKRAKRCDVMTRIRVYSWCEQDLSLIVRPFQGKFEHRPTLISPIMKRSQISSFLRGTLPEY